VLGLTLQVIAWLATGTPQLYPWNEWTCDCFLVDVLFFYMIAAGHPVAGNRHTSALPME
jgi:hypothetical protein